MRQEIDLICIDINNLWTVVDDLNCVDMDTVLKWKLNHVQRDLIEIRDRVKRLEQELSNDR